MNLFDQDSPDQSCWFSYFLPIFTWFVFFILGLILVLPYLITEINTFFHAREIPRLSAICEQILQVEPAQLKLVEINKPRREWKFYCLYSEPNLDAELTINQIGDNWLVTKQRRFSQTNEFFWPIYRIG